MKKKIASILKKALPIAAYILGSIFVIAATIATYYYAQGYRLNLDNKTIRKTGVLSVESDPSRAQLYVNGESIGRTPRTVTSVDEGIANVELTRDGYVTWIKNIPIKAERSSPIYPYLILSQPIQETVFTSDEEYIKGYTSNDGSYIFFITKSESRYSIWRFDITRNFWDLTENPKVVHTIETDITEIELNIAPDGRTALLLTQSGEKKVQNISLLHTVNNGVVIEEINLQQYLNDYKFTWSNDSKFIILESESDVITFKISDKTRYHLLRKPNETNLLWATDTEGFMYLIEQEGADEQKYFKLSQMLLDGTERTTLISNIYTKNEERYITTIRDNPIDYIPFTNSPESTRFSGDITEISIDQNTEGFFIETTNAAYWYSFELKKYTVINPYPSKFISFSPDRTKLLFEDITNKKIGVFVFKKQESDHVTQIGSTFIIDTDDQEEVTQTSWLYNSRNIMYKNKEKVKIVGIEGDNDTEVIDAINNPMLIDRRNENIYRLENQENGKLLINQFRIN